MIGNRWTSLLMLLAVCTSTAYALGQSMLGDSPFLSGSRGEEAAIHAFPDPTANELSAIRRALLPKFEITEPLLIEAS